MKRAGVVCGIYAGNGDKKISTLFQSFYVAIPLSGIIAVDFYKFLCGELLVGAMSADQRVWMEKFCQSRSILLQDSLVKTVKVYTVTQTIFQGIRLIFCYTKINWHTYTSLLCVISSAKDCFSAFETPNAPKLQNHRSVRYLSTESCWLTCYHHRKATALRYFYKNTKLLKTKERQNDMEIQVKSADRNLLLTFRGELDHHGARNALREVEMAIDAALPKKLVMDFADVTFMDSSGIALILRAQQRMQLLEGSVLVCNVPPQARRVLDAAGIGRLVTIR